MRLRLLMHGLLGGLLAVGLYAWGLFVVPDNLVHDLFMRLRTSAPAEPRITVVAIDDASVQKLGRWPWPREMHLRMIEQLTRAGAAVVAYNVFFTDPYKPAVDAQIAAAIRRHGRTLLPVYLDFDAKQVFPPIPSFAEAAAGLVNPHLRLGTDGIARDVEREVTMGGKTYRALGYEVYRLWRESVPESASLPTTSLMAIDFQDGYFHTDARSFASVLDDPGDLRGQLVLLGATAKGLGDTVSTPMAPQQSTPGIWVQANLAGNLMHGRLLRPLPAWGITLLLLATVAAQAALLQRLRRTWTQLAGLLGLVAGIGIASFALFRLAAVTASPVTLLAGVTAAYILYFLDTLATSNRALRREILVLAQTFPGPRTRGLESSAAHGMEMMRHLARARFAAYRQRQGDRLVLSAVSPGCPREDFTPAVTLDMLALGGRCVRWEEVAEHLRPQLAEPHYVAVMPHLVNDRTAGTWEFYFTEPPSDLALAAPVWLMSFVRPPGPEDDGTDLEAADTTTLIRLMAQLGRQINDDRQFYEAVLLSPHAGLIVCDPWGSVLFHNTLVPRLLNLPADAGLGQTNLVAVLNTLFPDVEEAWSTVWPQVVIDHTAAELTLQRDGRTLRLSLSPVFDRQGQLVAVYGSLLDLDPAAKQGQTAS